MYTLHYAKGTAALAVHIMLEECAAQYQARLLDFSTGDQRTDSYLAINPKGRVPALETSDGVLTETPAILAYLAQVHPGKNLAPLSAFDFARAQAFNQYIAATVHVAHAHKLRGARWSDDPAAQASMRAKVRANMIECGQTIEAHYIDGPWVTGASFSMCDPYLFLVARWLVSDGADLVDFPIIAAHAKAMSARPSVQTVMPLHQ